MNTDKATGADGDNAGNGNGLTRVTVNLTRKAVQALDAVTESSGYSRTDTINRALSIYAVLQEIMDRYGEPLNFTDAAGQVVERVYIV